MTERSDHSVLLVEEPETHRMCTSCDTDKPQGDFYAGSGNTCKSCVSIRSRRRYLENADEVKEKQRKYRQENPEKIRETQLWSSRKYRYGLTRAAWDRMWAQQGGTCVCGVQLSSVQVDVDHDHACCPGEMSCGKCVRGLICHPCNVALGMVNDSAERLRRLADYLDRAFHSVKILSP